MTRKPKWRTAEEVMRELENNPDYVRTRKKKDENFRQIRIQLDALLEPVLMKLKDAGFPSASLQELVQNFAPLPRPIVDILLEGLKECQDDRLQESFIRALGATRIPFNGRALTECFDKTESEGLRFAILNTIALAKPHSIDEWFDNVWQNDYRRKQLIDLGY